MEAFAFARRLTFRKAVTAPVHTLSAILAGSGMAQVALAMVLAEPLDRIINAYPTRPLAYIAQQTRSTPPGDGRGHVPSTPSTSPRLLNDASPCTSTRLSAYVDDISIHIVGTQQGLARAIASATDALIGMLDAEV